MRGRELSDSDRRASRSSGGGLEDEVKRYQPQLHGAGHARARRGQPRLSARPGKIGPATRKHCGVEFGGSRRGEPRRRSIPSKSAGQMAAKACWSCWPLRFPTNRPSSFRIRMSTRRVSGAVLSVSLNRSAGFQHSREMDICPVGYAKLGEQVEMGMSGGDRSQIAGQNGIVDRHESCALLPHGFGQLLMPAATSRDWLALGQVLARGKTAVVSDSPPDRGCMLI